MQRKSLILLATLAAVSAQGCRPGRVGKKPLVAHAQPHGELRLPGHDDATAPLDLTGTELDVTYDGNVLLWNPHVTPAQVSAISDASVFGRLAKADERLYEFTTLRPALAAADAAVTAKNAEIAANAQAVIDTAKAKLNSPEARALKVDAAAKWFDTSVENLQADGALDAAGAAAARENFKAYCEYKVYELATSRLIQLDYAERPSPLQMCEGYYKAQGLFAAGAESCKPAAAQAPAAAKANYFDCLWAEGVFKSQTFAAMAGTVGDGATCLKSGQKRAQTLQLWFASGLLRRVVFDNDVVGAGSPAASTYARTFADFITQSKPLLALTTWNKKPEYKPVVDCRQIASRNDVSAVAPDWQHALLTNLKSVAETASGGAQVFPLFDVSTASGASADQVAAVSATVRKFRQYVERRDGSKVAFDDGTVLTDVNVSADDQFFNQPIGAQLSANPENFEGASNEPDIKRIFDVEAALKPADLLAKGEALAAELVELQAQREELPKGLIPYDAKSNKTSQDGGAALTSPGAVALARKLTFTIKTQGDRAQLDLSFGSGLPVRACTALGSGQGFDCPNAALAADAQLSLTTLTYERSSGKLAIAIPVASDAALGLGAMVRAENGTEFSELPAGALDGRVIELDLYPNQLNEYYQFVTGVVRVKAGGKLEWDGSFSADNFGR